MSIYLKITSLMVFILFLANSVLIFVCYNKYEKTLNEIIQARFIIVGDHLENTISTGLRLGLTLKELQAIQKTLIETKAGDPEILSIQIFELMDGALGKTLFSTRKVGIGNSVPSHWISKMLSTEKGKIWNIEDDGVNLLGKTIYNMFDAPIGAVVVRFTEDYTKHKLNLVWEWLLFVLMTVSVGSSFCLLFSSFFIMRPFSQTLKKVTVSMRKILLEETPEHFISTNLIEEQFSDVLEKTLTVYNKLNFLKKEIISLQEKEEKNF